MINQSINQSREEYRLWVFENSAENEVTGSWTKLNKEKFQNLYSSQNIRCEWSNQRGL